MGPHAPEDGETASSVRTLWEYYHKGSGWFAVLLAIPTIALGTLSLPSLDEGRTFQIAYGVGCGGLLLLLIAYILYDKKTYEQETKKEAVAGNKDDTVVKEQTVNKEQTIDKEQQDISTTSL